MRLFLDIAVGGAAAGRLTFALASALPAFERSVVERAATYRGCTAIGLGKWSHRIDDDGALTQSAELGTCTHELFTGVYYGMAIPALDPLAASPAPQTTEGSDLRDRLVILAADVDETNRGLRIVRLGDAPAGVREGLLVGCAAIGQLVDGAAALGILASPAARKAFVITDCGALSDSDAALASAQTQRQRADEQGDGGGADDDECLIESPTGSGDCMHTASDEARRLERKYAAISGAGQFHGNWKGEDGAGGYTGAGKG